MAKNYMKNKGAPPAYNSRIHPRRASKTAMQKVEAVFTKGVDIKKKYKITNEEIAAMWKSKHDSGTLKSVLSPVAKRVKEQLIEEVRQEILIKRPRILPWVAIGLAFMQRGNTPGLRSDPKSDPIAMQQFTSPCIARIGAGRLFPHKIKIDAGPPTGLMQTAKSQFGVKTYKELHVTGYKFNLDMYLSQAGINRKGFYMPWIKALGTGNYNAPEIDIAYDQFGTVTTGMIRNFIYEYGASTAVQNYMAGTNSGNLDLQFPIVSTTSIHSIRNRMEFTPIDLTVYLVRARVGTKFHPMNSVYKDWGLTEIVRDPSYAPVDAPDDEKFVFPREQNVVIQLKPPGDPDSEQVTQAINVESSTQLGVTPQWGPTFNERWEVCDVIKERIAPEDIYELHFERSFKYPHSYRQMLTHFDTASEGGDLDAIRKYCPGDYEFIFSFQGVPGTCEGNVPNSVLNVDALKSRIAKTVRHSLQYSWKTSAPGDPKASTTPEELRSDGWITSTAKNCETERRTAYFNDGYKAIVTSDETSQVGGAV